MLAIYIGIRVGGVGLGLIGGSGAIYIGHHETEQVDVGVWKLRLAWKRFSNLESAIGWCLHAAFGESEGGLGSLISINSR